MWGIPQLHGNHSSSAPCWERGQAHDNYCGYRGEEGREEGREGEGEEGRGGRRGGERGKERGEGEGGLEAVIRLV